MTCIHYRGGTRCGLKSEFYVLAGENILKYCRGVPALCEILAEHVRIEEEKEKALERIAEDEERRDMQNPVSKIKRVIMG
jgi:hypothetical protein